MPREPNSPLCFRLPAADRRLVETVAAYRHQTVSDYVREIVIEHAEGVVGSVGSDKILTMLAESNERLNEEKRELYEQAVRGIGSPRRP